MKEIMNLKFNRKIQKVLNNLLLNEQYHRYTLGELLKIIAIDIAMVIVFIAVSCI